MRERERENKLDHRRLHVMGYFHLLSTNQPECYRKMGNMQTVPLELSLIRSCCRQIIRVVFTI